MDRDDKIPAGDIKANSNFLRWLDNFWYHNKVITLIILFALFVLVICIFQMCSAESEDISLIYGGPYLMTKTELEGVRSVLNNVMPEDYNNDGKKYIELITYQIMSTGQLEELSGGTGSVDKAYFSQEYNNYSNMLMTGECSVYLVDPWLYEGLAENGRLQKLVDVTGVLSSSAYGEYGVRLGDTELYKYYAALRILPADTVVCLLMPYLFGKSSNKETYEKSKEMFKSIVDFKAPGEINS
jgi:hypothetical protein